MAAAYPMLHCHGRGSGRTLDRFRFRVGPADRRSRLFHRACRRGRLVCAVVRAAGVQRAAARFRPADTTTTCARRSAGTNWSRPLPASAIPCPRIAGKLRHPRGQLRRARRHRDARPALPSAPAHQHDQLGLAARLSHSAANHADRRSDSRKRPPTRPSPAARWPDITATPRESGTKRARTIRTFSSAAVRACPGRSSGRSISRSGRQTRR